MKSVCAKRIRALSVVKNLADVDVAAGAASCPYPNTSIGMIRTSSLASGRVRSICSSP